MSGLLAESHDEISPGSGYDGHADLGIGSLAISGIARKPSIHASHSRSRSRHEASGSGPERSRPDDRLPGGGLCARGARLDAVHYRELVGENDVERIVIGLPLHTSGREGQSTALARTFGDWLVSVTGRPVIYHDERYSTVEAEQRLIDAGLKREKRKALRDQLAAQIMLQGYLDAGCPETEAPAAPLADVQEIDPSAP